MYSICDGAITGGFCFILPGLLSMLCLCVIYVHIGHNNVWFQSVFKAIQPCITAIFIYSTYQLGNKVVHTHSDNNSTINMKLCGIVLLSCISSMLHINFVLTLIILGICNAVSHSHTTTHRQYIYTVLYIGTIIMLYVSYVAYTGHYLSVSSEGIGVAPIPSYYSLYKLGLLCGSLSFGGAFSSIPFMQSEVTVIGTWMTTTQFLDGIALASILPAPLIIFTTFIGYAIIYVIQYNDMSYSNTTNLCYTYGL